MRSKLATRLNPPHPAFIELSPFVSQAFIRSGLWDPTRHLDRTALPTNGQILSCLRGDEAFDAAAYDAERAARYARREGFYGPMSVR